MTVAAAGTGGHWLEFRRTLWGSFGTCQSDFTLNLASLVIQFLSLQEIQSNKLESMKEAVRSSTLTVARNDMRALKAESGNL